MRFPRRTRPGAARTRESLAGAILGPPVILNFPNLGNYPSTLDEPDDENDHGGDEQQVYVPGDDVKAYPADQPAQEQDDKNCPQHVEQLPQEASCLRMGWRQSPGRCFSVAAKTSESNELYAWGISGP